MSNYIQNGVYHQSGSDTRAHEPHSNNLVQNGPYQPSFQCETCALRFLSSVERAAHMDAQDHYRESFKCETCPKTFRTEDLRDQHQELDGHYHRLHCTYCNTYHKSAYFLKRHLKTHTTRSLAISCPFCNGSYVDAGGVAHHIEMGSCRHAPALNREKVWQYYRKCDPQGVFTVTNHVGLYHCPATEGHRINKKFVSLKGFFRHLASRSCTSVNLRTVYRVVTGHECPQDTANGNVVELVLGRLEV